MAYDILEPVKDTGEGYEILEPETPESKTQSAVKTPQPASRSLISTTPEGKPAAPQIVPQPPTAEEFPTFEQELPKTAKFLETGLVSPESVPSGEAITQKTGLPRAVSVPVSAAAKLAAGAAGFATSPKGIAELAATKTVLAPAIFAKWAYDMIKGGVASVEDAVNAVGQQINEAFAKGIISANALPKPPPDVKTQGEFAQRLAEDAVNTAAMFLGGAAVGGSAIKEAARPLTKPTIKPTTTEAKNAEAIRRNQGQLRQEGGAAGTGEAAGSHDLESVASGQPESLEPGKEAPPQAVKPPSLTPVLEIAGKSVAGESHAAIRDAELAKAKTPEERDAVNEAFIDQSKHKFRDQNNNILSRDEAKPVLAQITGKPVTKPVESADIPVEKKGVESVQLAQDEFFSNVIAGTPAVKTIEGKVVAGFDHAAARERAREAGLDVGPDNELGQRAGWIYKGKFILAKDLDSGLAWQRAQRELILSKKPNKEPAVTPAPTEKPQSPTGGALETGAASTTPPVMPKISPTKGKGQVAPAVEKIVTEVKKVGRTQGQSPAKQVKAELIAKLQQAIEKAPSENELLKDETVKVGTGMTKDNKTIYADKPLLEVHKYQNTAGKMAYHTEYLDTLARVVPKVTIDIPGDGTFNIFNTKEHLGRVLENAKRIATSSTEAPKIRYTGISKADREWLEQQRAAQASPQPEPAMSGPGSPSKAQGPEQISQGPGARTFRVTTKPEQPESYDATSLKNAVAEMERAGLGMPESTQTERQSMAQAWIRAGRTLESDPTAGRLLADSVIANPKRGLTGDESALLLRHKVSVFNALNDAAEKTIVGDEASRVEAKVKYAKLSDEFKTLLDAIKARGSEWGREGRWRQAMAYEDYSFATQERLLRASLGRDLTQPEIENLLKEIAEHKRIVEQQKQYIADQDAKIAQMEVKAALSRIEAEAKAQPQYSKGVLDYAEKFANFMDKQGDAALARIRARREQGQAFSGPLNPEVLDDYAIYGAAKITRGLAEFAKWSDRMVKDIGDWIKPHLDQIWQASLARHNSELANLDKKIGKPMAQQVRRAVSKMDLAERQDYYSGKIKEKVGEGKKNEISSIVQKLARAFVESGITDRDQLIDSVHQVLKSIDPTFTRRQAMDAISGYGDFKQLTKDQISVQLRDLKGQMQQVAKLEDMQSGKPPLKTGIERRIPSREESKLIQRVNELKREFQIPIDDPNTQLRSSLDELKKRMQTRIADLTEKMAVGDYSRPTPRKPIALDPEALKLQADKLRIEKRFAHNRHLAEMAQRNLWQKGLDAFVKWERAFKLSSPVVFGKLGAAAMTRVVTTATEEAVGGAISKIPGISRVAAQAPREGGLNVKAMAKGLTDGIMKGMSDAWQTARRGGADIDVAYGDKILDRDWANFFGQLHGMMKAPIKRGEFALSLEKRTEHAIRNGIDVTDPMVETRLATESLDDGYRSIFMQHGFSSDMFNQFVTMLERNKKRPIAGEISARALRFLMPVVRVPLNIVAETATGVHGIPTASARVMFHTIRGTLDSLPPEVADSIMRQFKKGSIGLGLMAIGYFNSQNIGGYDWRQKRKPGEAKFSGFQVKSLAGIWPVDKDGNIPRWLTHAPWFELMQIGATIRRVKEEHVGKTGVDKGIGEGLWAAGVGLLEETPFIGQLVRVNSLFGTPQQRTTYLGQLAQSTVDPQLLIKIADLTDKDEQGNVIERKPKTILQYIEEGLPWLRRNVPAKNQASQVEPDKFNVFSE